jgi:hypothetical protein
MPSFPGRRPGPSMTGDRPQVFELKKKILWLWACKQLPFVDCDRDPTTGGVPGRSPFWPRRMPVYSRKGLGPVTLKINTQHARSRHSGSDSLAGSGSGSGCPAWGFAAGDMDKCEFECVMVCMCVCT